MSEFIDAAEVGKRLQVKPRTVLDWSRRGIIPSLRVGQRRPVLFDFAEVVKAIRERQDRRAEVAHA